MSTKSRASKSVGLKLKASLSAPVMDTFACKSCLQLFPSRNKMFIHIRDMHDKMNSSSDSEPPLDLDRFPELKSSFVDSSIKTAGEDSSYRVVIKPQGLPTMGKTSLMRADDLMLSGAEASLSYKKAIPCHRLDSSTGGLVVCSKSRPAEVCIKMCFRQKLIHKRYRAIVPGRLEPKEGSITALCGGKESLTKYDVVNYTRSKRYGWISTVDCWPVTGRKHQIRKHLMSVGHAVLGDRRYSHASSWPERIGGRELMFLWSLEVSFPHPINTYTPAENKIISDDILLKVALEGDKQVNGNSDDIDDCGDDEDDCDVDLPPGGQGNTTSGSDANSIENRLLMNSSLQIREEMFGIETRSTVKVSIDEPVYYGIFRDCHYNEWEQGFRNM